MDAFMFYNELDVLELRLEVLDRYVDRFVLVEAEVNHVGGPKALFFEQNKDRYSKWLPKITHVIVRAEECPTDKNPWSREKFQRECILRGIEDVPKDALVMVSDVDEIPDLSKIPYENLGHPTIGVHMWMFQYSLDYLFVSEPWIGTVITTKELLQKFGPNEFRDHRWHFPVVQYGGWHLSSFGDEKMVLNKMKTFAHALDDNEHRHLQTEESIKQWIAEGKFIDGKTELIRRGPEVPLPGSVEVLRRLNLGKFP